MSVPEDIDEAIEQSALGPKKVQIGNQSVEQHSIQDLIAADHHVAAKASSSAGVRGFGLRFQKIIPPGGG